MVKLLKKTVPQKPLSIKRFNEIRNRVLVIREVGGLGDILMHRMMFEDFKRVMPEAHIVWAVPPDYFHAAEGHPFVDEVVNCRTVDTSEFVVTYNTTTACGRYESKIAPLADKHRSDIWANHCGVVLTKHDMHLEVEPDMKEWAKAKIHSMTGGRTPAALISPISAQLGKNMTTEQAMTVARLLRRHGCFPFASHNTPLYELQKAGLTTTWGMSIKQWIALVDAADYVVSVDTSTFHCAGGLGKPLTGVFTFIDGKVYGKYYKFSLVQKHRDNGDWPCGPCFNWPVCPKCPGQKPQKPCSTEISEKMLADGLERMFQIWPIKGK